MLYPTYDGKGTLPAAPPPGFPDGQVFSPASGTIEEWNEALERVEDFLRANRLHSRIHQAKLSRKILACAMSRHAKNPRPSPTTIAIEEARDLISRRVVALVADAVVPSGREEITGRVAFMLADGPEVSPDYLLGEEDVPADLRARISQHTVRAGPDLAVSPMVPRPIDLGLIPDVAEFAWDLFERRPILRMFFLWTIFLLTMLVLFFLLRGRF